MPRLYHWRSRLGLAPLCEALGKAARLPHSSLNRRLLNLLDFTLHCGLSSLSSDWATPLAILQATRIAIYLFFLITSVGVVLAFLWRACFVCVFSPDSLGIYLKGNMFIAKHVGLFILSLHFLSVEIGLSEKNQNWRDEWWQAGMGTLCWLGGFHVASKDHLSTLGNQSSLLGLMIQGFCFSSLEPSIPNGQIILKNGMFFWSHICDSAMEMSYIMLSTVM